METKNSKDYSLNISVTLFRYFIRKFYDGIILTDEDIDEIRIDFIKYLEKRNFTEVQQKNCLPKNEIDVMINMDNQLRVFGFPPAFILHFTNYVEEETKRIKENN